MNLTAAECRARFVAAPVAVLGTAGEDRQPHLVPVTHVAAGDHVYIAIDSKPKRSANLRRLRNIAVNPQVSLLVDRYAADWTQLWWVRADGHASVTDMASMPATLLATFAEKYPPYRNDPPSGAVIDIHITSWHGWAYSSSAGAVLS